jgi:hypothetical protein
VYHASVSGVRLQGGVFFYGEVGVLKVNVCGVFPLSYLNFTNRRMSALRGGMADEAGF